MMIRLRSVFCVLAGLVVLCTATGTGRADVVSSSENGGLKCSISLQGTELRVGDQLVLTLAVENVSDKDVRFYFPDVYQAGFLGIRTGAGEEIRGEMSAVYGPATRDYVLLLRPGEVYRTQIRGMFTFDFAEASVSLPAASRPIILDFLDVHSGPMYPGDYTISFRYPSEAMEKGRGVYRGKDPVWKGRLSCGPVRFSLRLMSREELDRNIELLRTGSIKERTRAVEVVGANADRQAVPVLLEMLEKNELARYASNALCAIRDVSIIPQLTRLFRETKSGNVQQLALETLICLKRPESEELLSLLIETLKSGVSYESRGYAVGRIGDYGFFEGIPALVEAANDGDPIVQRAAVDVLGVLGERLPADRKSQVTAPLVQIMKSTTDSTVRSRAAASLGQVGDKTAVPDLIKALDDPDLWVGSYAAHSLGRLAGPEAIPALQRYEKRAETQSQARAALEAILAIRQRIPSSK